MDINELKPYLKEGVDESEVTSKLEGLNPLSRVETQDQAWELINQHKALKSVFDSKQSKAALEVEENLMKGKFQEALKAKEAEIRAELIPNETPEQKRIRELEEKLAEGDREKQLSRKQDELSNMAKELDFDPLKARDYAIYGDKAEEKLKADVEWFNSEIEKRLVSQSKEKYKGDHQPSSSKVAPADIDTKIKEARAAGNADLALRLQMLKNQSQ